jgi:subtilisin family serine protease
VAHYFIHIDDDDPAAASEVAGLVTGIIATYPAQVLVDAVPAQIGDVESAGYIVDPAPEIDALMLPNVTIDTDAPPPSSPPGWEPPAGSGHWIVVCNGPLLPAWSAAISGAGAAILGTLTAHSLLCSMDPAAAAAVEAIDGVKWVGRYEPVYKVDHRLADQTEPVTSEDLGTLAGSDGSAVGAPGDSVEIAVEIFSDGSPGDLASIISGNGGSIQKESSDAIIALVARSVLPLLAKNESCAQVAQFDVPEIKMDVARTVTAASTVIDRHGLTGKDEIVCVADTGLDRGVDNETLLDDFKQFNGIAGGRVRAAYTPNQVDASLAATVFSRNAWDDPQGHGTHVAGIVLGNGRLSDNRAIQGAAYEAELVMQSLRDSGNLPATNPALRGIPANLTTLFDPVYTTDNARVHNNSWGGGNTSNYAADSRQIDEFVWKHPDMVIVFAASNDGADRNPGSDGVIDWQSLSNEASAKNNITVGANENNKPFIDSTWNGGWPADFPTHPVADDKISDNPQHVVAFSSRGPSMAGAAVDRLLPDILAPGVSIHASLSQNAPVPGASPFWGPHVAGSAYVYKGGTSMAAPHVSGLAALIREYLRTVKKFTDPLNPDLRRRRPSAALIKALLVHGAQPVTGAYTGSAITNGPPHPSCHQGYGLVNLRAALFSNSTTGSVPAALQNWLPRRTIFVDDPARTLNAFPPGDPNRRIQHTLRINIADATVPMRATLAWTDYYTAAGANGALINRLRLRIRRVSDGAFFNVLTPAGAGPAGINVRRNNVQQIDIPTANLQAGLHDIQIRALAVSSAVSSGGASLGEEQDFALVVSGAISQSDHAVPGTMANLPDLAFVDLEPDAGVALHDGLAPSPERPADNPGSPDIIISTDDDPNTAAQAENIVVGTQYFIHVRVRNLGWADADNAQVRIYHSDPATPMAWPGDWSPEGFEVGDAPTHLSTVDAPARGEAFAGPFKWTPAADKEWVVLFVRAEHGDDPIVSDGDVRLDNNITRRDLHVLDSRDAIPDEPSGAQKFWFWIISGFGSPRDIRLRLMMLYEDVVDGQVKPMPAGVTVQIWDDDTFNDDLIDTAATRASAHPDGGPATVIDHTINTYEGGERNPDLYIRVLMPEGDAFSDFRRRSYFVSGAPYWMSNLFDEADGGFYRESFGGDSVGVSGAVSVIMRPSGIRVHAKIEVYDPVFNQFEKIPEGVEVVLRDSKNGAPTPILARAATDENGEIRAVILQREDHEPSIYFTIDKDENDPTFSHIGFFYENDRYSSRNVDVEVVSPEGTVSTRSGHFENWTDPRLVAADETLRIRLRPPGVLAHLKFEYFDREAGTHLPVPQGTHIQAWLDGAHAEAVNGMVGPDGRAELSVPKNGADKITFSVRVRMSRSFADEPDPVIGPRVIVRQGGSVIEWDTRNRNDATGANGLFTDIRNEVGTVAAPKVFQIGTGMGDADVKLSAPYILRVVGDIHHWLRTRTGDGGWRGNDLTVELDNTAGQGSSFGPSSTTLTIHTAHTAPGARQFDPGNARPDHWNRIAIAHQYGHSVLEDIVQRLIDPAVAIGNHNGYDGTAETTAARAFAEGWCDYLSYAHLVQETVPASTVSAGPWTAHGAGSMHAAVGGDPPDDDAWIASGVNPAGDTAELRFGALTDPVMSSGHVLRIRHRINDEGRRVELTVKLFQGATEIAAWSREVSSTEWQTTPHTLTALQTDQLGAYGNLRVKVVATGTAGHNRQVQISWIQLEVPHERKPDATARGWRGSDNDGADSHAETVPTAVAQMLWSIDKEIVARNAAAIESDVNRTRFRELIWNRITSLAFETARQIPMELYRRMQTVSLESLQRPFDHTEQLRNTIRQIYERSGLVFSRGRIQAIAQQQAQSAAPPRNEVWRLTLAPVDIARLHAGAMAAIASYQVETAPTGTIHFVLLDSFINANPADQRATLDIDISLARTDGLVASGNTYDLRVIAIDEFGARDSFADDFTGNADTGGHGVTSTATWMTRLSTVRPGPSAVP